jgi:hypothetical protein
MRKRMGLAKSLWLLAFGTIGVLVSGAAQAADRARSTAVGHRASSVASEPAPLLLRDRTGATVKIWSRNDGFTTKIAWARNDGSGWGPAHDLTFGLGIDREPAVTVTSAGAWLFWRDDRGGVFYAPLDIGSGRLLGVPAPLVTGGVPSHGPGLEGGTDVPVVMGNCDPTDAGCIPVRRNPPSLPGVPNPTAPYTQEGGTDVPVTGSANSTGPTLISGSDPGCERQFVSVAQGSSLLVSELDGAGRVRSQHTVRVNRGVRTEDAGPAAASFFLIQTCGGE